MLKRVQHDRLFGLLYRRTEETDYSLYVWCLYRARWCQKGQLSKRKKSVYPMERSWETVADSRLCRRQMCGICLNTTGSRTRGYSPSRASRLCRRLIGRTWGTDKSILSSKTHLFEDKYVIPHPPPSTNRTDWTDWNTPPLKRHWLMRPGSAPKNSYASVKHAWFKFSDRSQKLKHTCFALQTAFFAWNKIVKRYKQRF